MELRATATHPSHMDTEKDRPVTADADTDADPDADTDGTLLVAVANVETAERLLDTAADVAADRSYGVMITYVVEVPPQVPLSEGENVLDEDDRAILDHAEGLLEGVEVPVESRIRYARDTATGIVGAADEHDVDLVLMGWRGRPPRRGVVLGSFIDRVLRNAPCDVLVKRIRTPQADHVDAVLVPVTGGPHTHLAIRVGGAIARRHDATLTLLHVLPEDAESNDREAAESLLDDAEAVLGDATVERRLVEHDRVADAITDETARHDVTVLGASERGLLRRKLLGTVSEAVGRHAAGTVMIAQRHPTSASREEGLTKDA